MPARQCTSLDWPPLAREERPMQAMARQADCSSWHDVFSAGQTPVRSMPATLRMSVRRATFATDALELTGHRTPTTALEALSTKHQLELTAECHFSGIEYNVDVKSRLAEIRKK